MKKQKLKTEKMRDLRCQVRQINYLTDKRRQLKMKKKESSPMCPESQEQDPFLTLTMNTFQMTMVLINKRLVAIQLKRREKIENKL